MGLKMSLTGQIDDQLSLGIGSKGYKKGQCRLYWFSTLNIVSL